MLRVPRTQIQSLQLVLPAGDAADPRARAALDGRLEGELVALGDFVWVRTPIGFVDAPAAVAAAGGAVAGLGAALAVAGVG
jgi:hypothetical protein